MFINKEGKQTTKNAGKPGVFNTFFTLIFIRKVCCDQILHRTDLIKEIGTQASTGKEQVKECLDKIGIFEVPGPKEILPRVLKEQAEVISEPLAVILENL